MKTERRPLENAKWIWISNIQSIIIVGCQNKQNQWHLSELIHSNTRFYPTKAEQPAKKQIGYSLVSHINIFQLWFFHCIIHVSFFLFFISHDPNRDSWHHHQSVVQFSLDCCLSNKYMSFQEYRYECEKNWQANKKFTQFRLTCLLASMCCARFVTRFDVKCVLSCREIWIHAIFTVEKNKKMKTKETKKGDGKICPN